MADRVNKSPKTEEKAEPSQGLIGDLRSLLGSRRHKMVDRVYNRPKTEQRTGTPQEPTRRTQGDSIDFDQHSTVASASTLNTQWPAEPVKPVKPVKQIRRVAQASALRFTPSSRIYESPRANKGDANKYNNQDDVSSPIAIIKNPLVPFLPYLEKSSSPSRYLPHQKLAPSSTVDIKVMKNWLNTCRNVHGNHCHSSIAYANHTPMGPQWLVDVRKGCIVSAPTGVKYLTLSYVWGRRQPSVPNCTTKSNLERLKTPGFLDGPDLHISRSVRQAIQLTRDLDEQYLWVDKLCIVQDDLKTKQQQLDVMATIYAGSDLTIIAAYGTDEDDGLFEVETRLEESRMQRLANRLRTTTHALGVRKEWKKPTFADKKTLRQPAEVALWDHADIMKWYAQHLLASKWYSRGWTFQEYLFARRKLVLQNNTANWECHCACWQEGQGVFNAQGQHKCSEPLPAQAALLNASKCPDMHRFSRLVALYNQRTLSFPEDALDAFAGVLSDLSRVFPSGFVAGLPTLFFDATLIWQPYSPMTRRVPITREDASLPSWSWIGWHCDVNSESFRSAYSYMRRNPEEFTRSDPPKWFPNSWFTFSTVTWCHSHDVGGPRTRIDRLLHPSIAVDAQKESYMPPEGWEKKYCSEKKMYFYRHEYAPGQEFWHPIPLVHQPPDQPMVNRSQYLHCVTRRAFLKIRAPFNHTASSTCTALELERVDNNGWAGVLRLGTSWTGNSALEYLCELIELSRGSVQDQITEEVSFDEWRREGCLRENGLYEFYNVMWIERDGDVTYRKAVGRVERSVWEEVATEYIDVTLG